MARKRFATSIGSAGAVGKNDNRVFAGNHRIENPGAHVLVALLVMEHQACNFVYRERPSLELVAIRGLIGQGWQCRSGGLFDGWRRRRDNGRSPRGIREG